MKQEGIVVILSRGPVIGPMVYSAAYCTKKDSENLKEMFKVDDSKTLNVEQRDKIFEKMTKHNKTIKNNLIIIGAHELSTKMLKIEKYNLNLISHDAAIELIRQSNKQIQDIGGILSEVYIDTVGDPKKYQTKVEYEFPEIKIVVSKKADSLFPIVSAASIFAKVTRDKCVSDLGKTHGSGYPSDPKTVEWISKNRDPIFGFPHNFIRFSWSTITKVIDDDVKVDWSDDEDYTEPTINRDTFFQEKRMDYTSNKDFY